MIVAERLENAPNHAVLKMPGSIKGGDSAGVLYLEAEMASLPRDCLIKADQAGSHACNRPLTGPIGRGHMQVDVA